MTDKIGHPRSGPTRRTAMAGAAAAGALPLLGAWAANAHDAAASPMVRVDKSRGDIWVATIHNPPFNLVVPQMVRELHDLVVGMDQSDVRVVLFQSDVDGYFINHFDLAQAADFPMLDTDPPLPGWTDLVLRLTRSPVISIAKIRGRTRGGGNEFALACDLRYGALDQALFGQPEVGAGILPGGGGTERLPRLIGRNRALEVFLTSQDYSAAEAERMGWITRAVPDAALDDMVGQIATRIAGFEKASLSGVKAQVNRATLPPDADVITAYSEYFAALAWPGFAAGRPAMGRLIEAHGIVEVEENLGYYLGEQAKMR